MRGYVEMSRCRNNNTSLKKSDTTTAFSKKGAILVHKEVIDSTG